MKIKLVFAFVLLLHVFTSQSQSIKGILVTTKEKSAMDFALVALLKQSDSSIVASVTSKSGGKFEFYKIPIGNYIVKSTLLSYKPAFKDVRVENMQKTVILDTIRMEESSAQIGEVVVMSQKLQGNEMIDRTSYSVPSLIAKTCTDGMDLLKRVPGVQIMFDDYVMLEGKSPAILVEGKARDKEYLSRLQPSDIKNIEVINNPTGKYGNYSDGVINIILKREARFGVNGNIGFKASLKNLNEQTGNGSLEYSKGKITFYIAGYGQMSDRKNILKNSIQFLAKDSVSSYDGKGKRDQKFYSVNAGFDYYINEKNSVGFNARVRPMNSENYMDNYNSIAFAGKNMELLNHRENTSDNFDNNYSLYYRKQFVNPVQEFSMEAIFSDYKAENGMKNESFTILNSEKSPNLAGNNFENSDNKNQSYSIKADYVQPVGKIIKIEGGYQFVASRMDFDSKYMKTQWNNTYNYDENRQTGYLGGVFSLKKFMVQSTVRFENSDININSETSNNYTCVLPSANLLYKFSTEHSLKLNYTKRISRPQISSLNPFMRESDNLNYSVGNSDLLPEYRDRVQMTYTFNHNLKIKFKGTSYPTPVYFSPYIYKEWITDRVGYINTTETINNKIANLSRPLNLQSGSESGAGVNLNFIIFSFNSRFFQMNTSDYRDAAGNLQIKGVNYWNYSMSAFLVLPLPLGKDNMLMLSGFWSYTGKAKIDQTETSSNPYYGTELSWKYKNHRFSIEYQLPFTTQYTLSKSVTRNSYNVSNNSSIVNTENYLQFRYRYRFSIGKQVQKVERKLDAENEEFKTR
jgi:hypothetical protein